MVEMKQKLTEKINKPSSEALKKFDQLPVSKPKILKSQDAVSEFLDKASQQEASERVEEAKKAAESDPVVNAAHKDTSYEDDGVESNPLTELYLKKHPNLLSDARKTDWNSIANGDDQ